MSRTVVIPKEEIVEWVKGIATEVLSEELVLDMLRMHMDSLFKKENIKGLLMRSTDAEFHMTMEEIEKKIGHRVHIIKSKEN